MTCSRCKKEFEIGNRPDGLPNGVGFELEDGTIINMCANCITELGELDGEEQDKFFNDIMEG